MALVTPSLASLTSKISESRVGERMGLLASISSLGLAAGSFIVAGLYSLDIHLPYFSFSIVVLVVPVYIIKRYLNSEISRDRKSTRLNSSHVSISYAVF